jgi:ribose 5-phosphate isomerase A
VTTTHSLLDHSTVVEHALSLVRPDSVIGLGSGRAATAFVHGLGRRVRDEGFPVRGVPTSENTASLARQLGIPLVTLDQVEALDLTVDGADEVDPELNLIKGLGGALVREKIVAAASRNLVILVGPEKLVPVLGSHGVLPVEVLPFALTLCRRRLDELGCRPELRRAADGDQPWITDNGNYILDCQVRPIPKPSDLERSILAIPGVIDTGLFLGMAWRVLIQEGNPMTILERKT